SRTCLSGNDCSCPTKPYILPLLLYRDNFSLGQRNLPLFKLILNRATEITLYIPESWTHQNVSYILNVTTKTERAFITTIFRFIFVKQSVVVGNHWHAAKIKYSHALPSPG